MFAVRVKQKLLILVKNKKKEMNEQAFRGPSVSSEVGSRCLVPHRAAQEPETMWYPGGVHRPVVSSHTARFGLNTSSNYKSNGGKKTLKLKNWPPKARKLSANVCMHMFSGECVRIYLQVHRWVELQVCFCSSCVQVHSHEHEQS